MNDKLTFAGFVKLAVEKKCSLWEVVLDWEEKNQQINRVTLWDRMRSHWKVMAQSVSAGLDANARSLSGLVGGEGAMLLNYLQKARNLSGESCTLAAARAMGVAVVNASMGRIVAAPTAGSCGILPAVLTTVAEKLSLNEEKIIAALFTAAGVGLVIDENATTSGAKGGCQAECGAAACMAAVAAVELAGGTPHQAAHAGAIALKSVIGLACDPVAGLVEIPCVKRNAMGSVNALLAADMALAGIESKIPLDEVIGAMGEVGDVMHDSLKETAQGGLANTPTARKITGILLKSQTDNKQ